MAEYAQETCEGKLQKKFEMRLGFGRGVHKLITIISVFMRLLDQCFSTSCSWGMRMLAKLRNMPEIRTQLPTSRAFIYMCLYLFGGGW